MSYGRGHNLIRKLLQYFNIDFDKLPKRYKYLVIIGLIGIMLMLVSSIFSNKQNDSIIEEQKPPLPVNENDLEDHEQIDKEEASTIIEQLEKDIENQLVTMLEASDNLSDVEVMVNVDSTNIYIYEKDMMKGKQITDETDQSGGERKVEDDTEESHIVFVRKGEKEEPLLIQTKKPAIRGVLIVAKGLGNLTTQNEVIDAVSKVLDVPSHRISVMNKQ